MERDHDHESEGVAFLIYAFAEDMWVVTVVTHYKPVDESYLGRRLTDRMTVVSASRMIADPGARPCTA